MSDAADQLFYFDDFFDSAKTVVIPVTIKGRVVPITIKAGLSVEDRLAAQAAAVKKLTKPNGETVILGIDEGAATEELMLRAIVSWPFVQRDGARVPVTKENLRKLLGGIDALAEAVQKIDSEGEASLTPFAPPSAEA